MAYNKHEWKARTGVGLNKFKDADGRVYEFTPAPDEVTEPGTPFSAEWMNEMEAGIAAAGIIYGICETAAATAAKIVDTGGAPEQLANGDNFRILFVNEVQAGATLNINGIGAYPIIDNYTGAAIVKGDIPADYIGDIMFEDGKFLLLNAESFTPKNANIMQFINGIASTLGGDTVSLDGKVKIAAGTYTGSGTLTRTLTLAFTPKLLIINSDRYANTANNENFSILAIITSQYASFIGTYAKVASPTIPNLCIAQKSSVTISGNSITWSCSRALNLQEADFSILTTGSTSSDTKIKVLIGNYSGATYNYVAIG